MNDYLALLVTLFILESYIVIKTHSSSEQNTGNYAHVLALLVIRQDLSENTLVLFTVLTEF